MSIFDKIFNASAAQSAREPMTSREANELLAKAVTSGDVRAAEYALKATGSPNWVVDRGYYSGGCWQTRTVPMLWDTVQHNRPQMAKLLLQYGADVDAAYRNTPLQLAVEEGRTPIVRILLDAGASLAGNRYEDVLRTAQGKQYADVIKMLSEEPGRRRAVAEAAQREKDEALRSAQEEAERLKQAAANPQPQTDTTINVMKPLAFKGQQKKKWFS